MPQHTHQHDHTQPPAKDEEVHGYYQFLGLALRELLVEKGIITADEIRLAIEYRDSITPARGSAVIARSWSDPEFKARLLGNGKEAVAELDIEIGALNLVAVENTPSLHNVIVCTLCSCYPRDLLGLPPSWYKSLEYRSRIVREPRAVLREFGTELPDDVEVRVHDSTADIRYLVVPMRPIGTEELGEEALAELVTRDCMVGVTLPNTPD